MLEAQSLLHRLTCVLCSCHGSVRECISSVATMSNCAHRHGSETVRYNLEKPVTLTLTLNAFHQFNVAGTSTCMGAVSINSLCSVNSSHSPLLHCTAQPSHNIAILRLFVCVVQVDVGV